MDLDPFENAVDAIVRGDSAELARLVGQFPDLVRERSQRKHRSTLLHYVSANGVEDERQITPPNIVAVAKQILDAGADVNAESDAYRGRLTTLALAATSVHPEVAGVQIPLMKLLLEHGAAIDGPHPGGIVCDCLRNGRGIAAEFLASQGARLDLESAAGVGQLETVRGCFEENGALRPPATIQQLDDAFAWACEFGRTSIVEFLLRRGMDVNATLRHHGQTGLHWAAHGGHVETARLLLARGARVDTIDATYCGTPLDWALHAWTRGPEKPSHYETVAMLARAGAALDSRRVPEKLRSDARMRAALHGEDAVG